MSLCEVIFPEYLFFWRENRVLLQKWLNIRHALGSSARVNVSDGTTGIAPPENYPVTLLELLGHTVMEVNKRSGIF